MAAPAAALLSRSYSLKSRHKYVFTAGCVALVLVTGILDHVSGSEVRIFPLYYLPIGAGALLISRMFGASLAILSTIAWALSNWTAGVTWSLNVFAFNVMTQLVSFMVVALLLAAVRRRYEIEHDLSHKDTLTSLPNSRAFYELADLLLAGARRSGRPFTVAYLDLDNFKAVNDKRGHLEGDRALKETADILRRNTRASDIVSRLGGDEFIVFLSETGPEPARTMLGRILELLADAMISAQWPITASIGAVSFVRAPATVDEAVKRADSLMYRAKEEGRNRLLLEVAGAEDGGKSGLGFPFA